jgi:hypothetical protein
MISLLCGVPALTLGLGALTLLLSYLVGRPIGSTQFYRVELVSRVETNRSGEPVTMNPIERIVPSGLMIGVLFVGTCCGGIGIHLTRLRWPRHPIKASAAGVILCSVAFALVLVLFARAS